VLEDCDVGDDFLAARFPAEVCDLVDALTHLDGEDYPAFIRWVCWVPGARLIKEADISDNGDPRLSQRYLSDFGTPQVYGS
jgi:hypothetical protein